MDHTTQAKIDFPDAIETPRETLASEHTNPLDVATETTIPQATAEDTAEHQALQLAAPAQTQEASEDTGVAKTELPVLEPEVLDEPTSSHVEPSATETDGEHVPTTKLSNDTAPTPTDENTEVVEIINENVEVIEVADEPMEATAECVEVVDAEVIEVIDESVEVVEATDEREEVVEVIDEPVEIEVVEVIDEPVEVEVVEAIEANIEIADEANIEIAEVADGSVEVAEDEALVIVDDLEDVTAKDTVEVEDDTVEVTKITLAAVSAKDTIEVAEIILDEHKDVAEIETINVPSVMLETLEQAEQTLLATPEALEDPAEPSADMEDGEQQPVTTVLAEEKLLEPEVSEPVDDTLPAEMDIDVIPTQTLEAQRRASRQLSMLRPLTTSIQGLAEESRYRVTGSQAAIRRAVMRRWGRQGKQQKQRRWVRIICAAVIASILVSLSIPLCVGLIGYSTYNNVKGVATDGVNHLLAIKTLIPANKSDLTSVLNTQKLAGAKTELSQAQDDFLQLQDMVNRPDIESLLQQYAPQYSNKLDMARHLVQVALDVSRMGQELIGVAQFGANTVHSPLISSGSDKPLISVDNINTIEAALVHGQYYINDIQTQMAQVDLAQMPFGSSAQKVQLSKALSSLPQAQGMITQVQSLLGPVSWLLGVGQQRHFLVQTLDRGELRPSGGFEGQYGVLTLQDGRMSPFSLTDVAELDYNGSGNELGNHAPAQYHWMDFGNFGMRDANLSADYPTDARMIMQLFQQEGGGPVDGDIQITPVVIAQLLDLTGPLYIADYKDTVTAQNLEDKIHSYQQNFQYIGKEKIVTKTNTKVTRKAFTSEVGQLLLDRVKHLQVKQLMDLSKVLLTDLKTRDLQVYFDNQQAEQWLVENGDTGAMPQFTSGTDGFMVVQANISISKAAQYVHSTFNDQVSLDAQGGASHNLTITLDYQQKGPVYGFNSYADYLRIYAPANAQLRSAYGFNTGRILCTPTGSKPPNPNPNPNPNPPPPSPGGTVDLTGNYTDAGFAIYGCGKLYNTSPDSGYRYCPDHNYQLGYDGMISKAWPVQLLGGPKESGSDLPGYAMWGGMTLTPKNCTSTVTLSWYVPNVVQNTLGQPPYQLMVGHQAGWPVTALVNIDARALPGGVQSLAYDQTIDVDTLIALANRPLPPAPKPTTPTPTVTPTSTGKKP